MKNFQRNTFGFIAIVYCLGMIYQLFLVTHFQLNKEEITKIHCVNTDKPEMHCNGKCHLKKEILKTSTSSESADENSSNFTPTLFFVPFSQTLIYNEVGDTIENRNKPDNKVKFNIKNLKLDIGLPPPQAIF